jgi:transcriptional regulator of acetoin/glycerol metabolism
MGSPAPTDTTIPNRRAGGDRVTDAQLCIRWLYPDVTGRTTLLARPVVVLGRAEDAHAVLPGGQVSRHHAEVGWHGTVPVVRDLDSTNGVFVNGRRIADAALSEGDILRVGDWLGRVTLEKEPLGAGVCQRFAPNVFGGPTLGAALSPLRKAANSDLPIVLEGETGCGKEVIARAIHTWSRRKGPFVAVNCAALPEALAEGELFGYRAGAFTGAQRANPGHFRAADAGTLLLDEATDLAPALQPKLLRALESGEVTPLGTSRPLGVDVRVIVAAQEPLRSAVSQGAFRSDLYARVSGITARIPPLRERLDEVPFLFMSLLKLHAGGEAPSVEVELIERLCLHDWPFNVRELDLAVRRLLVLHGENPKLERAHLTILDDDKGAEYDAVETPVNRDEHDLNLLVRALRANGGNVAKAAARSNISRQRAYRLMGSRGAPDLEEFRRG